MKNICLSLFSLLISSTLTFSVDNDETANPRFNSTESLIGLRSAIPVPKVDTIAVTHSGKVFIRIDTTGKGATRYYEIYENSISPPNLLIRVPSNQDTVSFLNGADFATKSFIIQAIDGFDTTNRVSSSVYTTVLTSGSLTNPCAGEYTLNWSTPTGFSNGIAGYRIYADFTGNGYRLVNTINNASAGSVVVGGISRGVNHKFRVHAFNNQNAINISASTEYIAPSDLATDKLVPPPKPRCTYVNPNGSVTLSWLPAVDTVNNFSAYNIQYKTSSQSTWSDIPGDADDFLYLNDNSFTITGIDAQLEQYDFRITSLAGCDGRQSQSYNEISSIFLTADHRSGDLSKEVYLSWNLAGPNYGSNNFFNVYKSSSLSGSNFSGIGQSLTPGLFEDFGNTDVCDAMNRYKVSTIDSAFQSLNFTCVVQSSVASINIVDKIPPVAAPIKFVSYDLDNGGLNVFWERVDSTNTDSINFLTRAGIQSGLPVIRYVTTSTVFNPFLGGSVNQLHISFSQLDARGSSVTLASETKDICNNNSSSPRLFHQTMAMNVGWLAKDSVNKLSWNSYVGFNENFGVEYEVFYATSLTNPWISAGNAGENRTFEHLVPDGNEMYYYHVKARSMDTLSKSYEVSNSNIGLVYTAFVDTTINIPELPLLKQLGLYPNPTQNQLYLTYSGKRNLKFQIYNAKGQLFDADFDKLMGSYNFNVERLAEGIYFLLIQDGIQQSSLTFVKKE